MQIHLKTKQESFNEFSGNGHKHNLLSELNAGYKLT